MTENAHVRMAFENLNNLGVWVRINPGRQTAVGVDPRLASRTDLPDNPPNTAPADWTARAAYTYPDNTEGTYWAAAIYEMADRARASALLTVNPTITVGSASTTRTVTVTQKGFEPALLSVNSSHRGHDS